MFSVALVFLSSHYLDFIVTRERRTEEEEKTERKNWEESLVCVCLLVSHMFSVLSCTSSMVFRVRIFCCLSGCTRLSSVRNSSLSLTHLTEPNLSLLYVRVCFGASTYSACTCVCAFSAAVHTTMQSACVRSRPIIPKHSCSLKNSLKHYSMLLIELLTIYPNFGRC